MRLPAPTRGRLQHWKAVLWRPTLKVFGLVWTGFGALSLIRAETTWIPAPWRDAPILKWLPLWPWSVWAVVLLVGVVGVMLEGSYRLTGGDRQRALDRLAHLRVEGIGLLNEQPRNVTNIPAWIADWITREQAWRGKVGEVLRVHFHDTVRLQFETLGTWAPRNLQNSWGRNHLDALEMLAERIARLEAIIEHGVSR